MRTQRDDVKTWRQADSAEVAASVSVAMMLFSSQYASSLAISYVKSTFRTTILVRNPDLSREVASSEFVSAHSSRQSHALLPADGIGLMVTTPIYRRTHAAAAISSLLPLSIRISIPK